MFHCDFVIWCDCVNSRLNCDDFSSFLFVIYFSNNSHCRGNEEVVGVNLEEFM